MTLELISEISMALSVFFLILFLYWVLSGIHYMLKDIRKICIVLLSVSLSESQKESALAFFKLSKGDKIFARLSGINPDDFEDWLKSESESESESE